MTDRADVAVHLQALEEELLLPDVRRNAKRLRELLAPEYEEVGASGRVFGRNEVIALLSEESAATVTLALSDFQARWLAADLVQVRYRSRRQAANRVREAERTSLWRRSGEGWTMLYHQGTPVPSARQEDGA